MTFLSNNLLFKNAYQQLFFEPKENSCHFFAHDFLCKPVGCICSKHNDSVVNNEFEFGCGSYNTVKTNTAGSVWYSRNMRVAVVLVFLVFCTSLARSKASKDESDFDVNG